MLNYKLRFIFNVHKLKEKLQRMLLTGCNGQLGSKFKNSISENIIKTTAAIARRTKILLPHMTPIPARKI